jgi:CRISPR-associated protein Csb1
VVDAVKGISHVRVNRADGSFLTDTILEAHRLNSPYLMKDSGKAFFATLRSELGAEAVGPIDRGRLAQVLLKYDIGSLLHGIFLAQPELQGGRLRVARALSAFIEADGVRVAASGGVKNDHVNPSGDAKAGFGNVPFSRDEFTADRITLYVNFDLAQIRGYGLEPKVGRLLILLALHKLRTLLDGNLRLRTACDLAIAVSEVASTAPSGFALPTSKALQDDLRLAINESAGLMQTPTAVYADPLKSKQGDDTKPADEEDANDPSEG